MLLLRSAARDFRGLPTRFRILELISELTAMTLAQLFDCDRIGQLLDCDLFGLQTGEDTVEDSRAKAPQPRLWCGVRAGTNSGDTATILKVNSRKAVHAIAGRS